MKIWSFSIEMNGAAVRLPPAPVLSACAELIACYIQIRGMFSTSLSSPAAEPFVRKGTSAEMNGGHKKFALKLGDRCWEEGGRRVGDLTALNRSLLGAWSVNTTPCGVYASMWVSVKGVAPICTRYCSDSGNGFKAEALVSHHGGVTAWCRPFELCHGFTSGRL